MHAMNTDNSLSDIFLLLTDYIGSTNNELKLNVLPNENTTISYTDNKNIFFKSGQLLMFLYVTNINILSRRNIEYSNNTFYINFSNVICENNYNLITKSSDIILYLINKSVYNKEFLPEALNIDSSISKKDLSAIAQGFEITYKAFMKEKLNLLDLLKDHSYENIYVNLIKDIKLLNPHDLAIQLQFLMLKFNDLIGENYTLIKENHLSINEQNLIKNSNTFVDMIKKNSIIGFDNNNIELMWILYDGYKLIPSGFKNIYISLLAAYISKISNNKNYLELVKQSLTPLLSSNKLKMLFTVDLHMYNEIIKFLYVLNNYVELDSLNIFIKDNLYLFNNIDEHLKNTYISEADSIVKSTLQNKDTLDFFKSLIICPDSHDFL